METTLTPRAATYSDISPSIKNIYKILYTFKKYFHRYIGEYIIFFMLLSYGVTRPVVYLSLCILYMCCVSTVRFDAGANVNVPNERGQLAAVVRHFSFFFFFIKIKRIMWHGHRVRQIYRNCVIESVWDCLKNIIR